MATESPFQITAEIIRSIHDVSGLGYGITIPLTAVVLRTLITLPLALYSQKKLNRRIELRPLFYHWGEIIGMRTVARQKLKNVDLRQNKEAFTSTMSTVQKMVQLTI
jgi:hypothetical protein